MVKWHKVTNTKTKKSANRYKNLAKKQSGGRAKISIRKLSHQKRGMKYAVYEKY